MDFYTTEENGEYDGTRSCTIYTMTGSMAASYRTQFIKSSNLSHLVLVADKDGLPSVGPNRLM